MPRSNRHYRVTLADALSAHERALAVGGGQRGIPNIGLIESAIARPYSGYYRSIASKAAALVESVSTNHGFADGNKRTTLILVDLLIRKSGYELNVDGDLGEALEDLILSVVRHERNFRDLEDWLRTRLQRAHG